MGQQMPDNCVLLVIINSLLANMENRVGDYVKVRGNSPMLYFPQHVSLSIIRNLNTYPTELGHANLGKKQPCFPLEELHGS